MSAPAAEAPRPRLRVLVLPPENLSDRPVAARELTLRLDRVAAMAGAEVVGGERLDEYLARYRIRYTGGIDRIAARAARDDLGADAILVTTVELVSESPPRLALTLRLTGTSDDLPVLWMDGYARTGNDTPGLLALGIIQDFQVLQADALQLLSRSLEAFLAGEQSGRNSCPGGGWFRPRIAYAARPDRRDLATVAVLPFVNESRRRGAGEVVALQLARQIAAFEGLRLLEPGLSRDELLRRRIVMDDGVSLDQARVISASLEADLVVAGYVFDYEDADVLSSSNYTVLVIDRKTGRVVWESTSFNKGTDSETLFGLNTVSTAPRLTCRMAREILQAGYGGHTRSSP